MSEWNTRKPTEEEYIELAKCLMEDEEERQILKQVVRPFTIEQVIDYLKGYYVVVLDGYVSDSQGYAGRVFTITYGDVFFFTRVIEDENTGKLVVLRK